MPETKMSKTKWGLVVIVMIALGAAAISRSMAANNQQDHQHHQAAAQARDTPPQLIADGANDPSAIPDLVAYEFLFGSIAETPEMGEPEMLQARRLSLKTGLAVDKVHFIRKNADKFKGEIKGFDTQARDLKDKHWPKPDQSVRGQLTALQNQKEASLKKAVKSMMDGLSSEEKEAVNTRILEIKKKIKVYQDIPIEKFQGK